MTAAAGRKVTALRGTTVTFAEAADAFLSTSRLANPNTHRAYASVIDRTIAHLDGGERRLADVTDDEIGDALLALWGGCKPATWNRKRWNAAAAKGPSDADPGGQAEGKGRAPPQRMPCPA